MSNGLSIAFRLNAFKPLGISSVETRNWLIPTGISVNAWRNAIVVLFSNVPKSTPNWSGSIKNSIRILWKNYLSIFPSQFLLVFDAYTFNFDVTFESFEKYLYSEKSNWIFKFKKQTKNSLKNENTFLIPNRNNTKKKQNVASNVLLFILCVLFKSS